MEEYYQKVIQLQDKLRKSEEERLNLEIKFNEMIQSIKEEEEAHFRKLRSKYKKFLEEDRRRQHRNDKILEALDRIENRTAIWEAKTEKFKEFRNVYQNYLKHLDRTPSTFIEKDAFDTDEIVEKYMESISAQKRERNLTDDNQYSKLGNINSGFQKTSNISKMDDLTLLKTNKDHANSLTQNSTLPLLNAQKIPDVEIASSNKLSTEESPLQMHNNLERLINESSTLRRPIQTNRYQPTQYTEALPITNPHQTKFAPIKQNGSKGMDETHSKEYLSLKPNDFGKTANSTKLNHEIVRKSSVQGMDPPMSILSKIETNSAVNYDPKSYKNPALNTTYSQSPRHETNFSHPVSPIQPSGDGIQLDPEYRKNSDNQKAKAQSPVFYKIPAPDTTSSKPASNETAFSHSVPPIQASRVDPDVDKNSDTRKASVLYPQQKLPDLATEIYTQRDEGERVFKTDSDDSKASADCPVIDKTQNDLQPINDVSEELQNQHQELTDARLTQLQQNLEEDQHNNENTQDIDHVIYNQDQSGYNNNESVNYIESEQYDESRLQTAQLEYDETGQPNYYHKTNDNYQEYDPNLQPQYDENGQPLEQYGQVYETDNSQLYPEYDENGQPLYQYDQNGQPYNLDGTQAHYDQNGQLQYNQDTQEIQYDENGQPLFYNQDGTPLQYDENGQPLQLYDQNQYDENGQPVQQYYTDSGPTAQYYNYEEGGDLTYSNQENAEQYQAEDAVQQQEQSIIAPKELTSEVEEIKEKEVPPVAEATKVLDILETDSESTRNDTTKVSHDSDFDFSNS